MVSEFYEPLPGVIAVWGGALKLSRLSLFANTECTFFNLAFGGTHPWVQGFAWGMACYIGILSPDPEGKRLARSTQI